MALFTLWAYINRQVNKGGLVDPRVSHVVPQVMASETNEIKKEDTKAWKMYQQIRINESSQGTRGLAVTCKNKGMHNDTGWKALEGFCFKSQFEEELTIMQYIEKRLNNGWTQDQVYCYFNSGSIVDGCYYSRGELSKAN